MLVRADGGLWRMSQQRRRLDLAARIAGVEDISFHILHHTGPNGGLA